MKSMEPIAVVGMGGIFPEAPDLPTFWQNIVNKIDTSVDVPTDRWSAPWAKMVSEGYHPDKAYSRRACLIRDFCFDPTGFSLPPDWIAHLDPLYQLILHAGREAIAGCSFNNLTRTRIGVILAAIALPTEGASTLARQIIGRSFEAQALARIVQESPQSEKSRPAPISPSAKVSSLPAVLLAHAFDFRGSAFTLDAACASSLYAIKLACDDLNGHRADAILAGGVSRPDSLYTQVGFSQLRALSPSGHCAPFDISADGLVVGEGVGIVVLKRLADAISAGDAIHGVIRGIGLSNDLHGNLLAPDSEGQVRAMKTAYADSGWKFQDVDLIECHGAGTPLGDATEIASLNQLWGEKGWKTGQCALGSVKSMIGHLLTAAASAGLIKTLLAFNHRLLPPSIHFQSPPTNSPLLTGPFKIQTDVERWKKRGDNIPRRAAINAFGFGGINAHLLVEEYVEDLSCGDSVVQPTSGPKRAITITADRPTDRPPDDLIAIVGMGASFGRLESLDAFETALFEGRSIIDTRPAGRWKGCDSIAPDLFDGRQIPGAFIDQIQIEPGDFRIPPAEITDILPQHLLMLRTAFQAVHDAALFVDQDNPRMGAIIGIDFDFEATNYHLRWNLFNQVVEWNQHYHLGLNASAIDQWRKELAHVLGPPLTHERTLGALGSVVASRLAREFRLGGPSFVVSNGPASGLRALELGIRSVQQQETDAMLIGAVDLFGDVRNMALASETFTFSRSGAVCPFHPHSDGTLPGEGAGAMVIKRLEDAILHKDRIYAVIHSLNITQGQIDDAQSAKSAYTRAVTAALSEVGWNSGNLDFMELHASGDPDEDAIEKKALATLFNSNPDNPPTSCVLGATKPLIGHAGAAASMASLIKTALCLYRQQLPPWPAPTEIESSLRSTRTLTLITEKSPWRSPQDGDRFHAGVTALTPEGSAACVVMANHPQPENGLHPDQPNGRDLKKCINPIDKNREDGSSAADTAKITAPITITIGGLPPSVPSPPNMFPDSNETTADPGPSNTKEPPEIAIIQQLVENSAATEKAHRRFLEISADLTRLCGNTLALQHDILTRYPEAMEKTAPVSRPFQEDDRPADRLSATPADKAGAQPVRRKKTPIFSREMCMEFATGAVANVFGSDFEAVDSFPARVRLPDEPLMLVDRILHIRGNKGSLGSGRIVTEHDVDPKSWYLDGGRAPVCISVEAGQADLFLCAYLGIDFKVAGRRTYRLLDATVQFHRGLPVPGEVIRYDIQIEKFVRRGDTYLFFFHFNGTINDRPLITMTDGCAGFFTPQEVENSGGILQASDTEPPPPDKGQGRWEDLVPVAVETYGDQELENLRQGSPGRCFGKSFEGIQIPANLTLPGGRLRLIDRIQHLDPAGGRCRLGVIRAEADIHPDDWFLTCHFVDDMVMPGTLMYECCAHTLRVLLQRRGWILSDTKVCYEPVPGVQSKLKCRGPVTPTTRQVVYEVEITSVGYDPEPFVIGDAHMFADGRRIVRFENISMKMTGVSLFDLQTFWAKHGRPNNKKSPLTAKGRKAFFDRDQLMTFTRGNPSAVFGEKYAPFDTDRFIARLPSPPYLFIDNIIRCDPEPWVVKADGWVEAEFNPAPSDWYFTADRSGFMPYAVCLEIALQPCGWLAAYMGSALLSNHDLRFRNLGGRGTIKKDLPMGHHQLLTRVRLTQVSKAADMIIETYDFEVRQGQDMVYQGNTYFGFFTASALSQQEGIQKAEQDAFEPNPADSILSERFRFDDAPPLDPVNSDVGDDFDFSGLQLPATSIRMIDQIDLFIPQGGPHGLGYIRAVKMIDPDEWFFKAHFFQDPVCPGSLGLESFIQILKFYAITTFKDKIKDHFFSLMLPTRHEWIYRGQILPFNKVVTVEAVITRIDHEPILSITADGFLSVDGRCIYAMKQFGIRLIPQPPRSQ